MVMIYNSELNGNLAVVSTTKLTVKRIATWEVGEK